LGNGLIGLAAQPNLVSEDHWLTAAAGPLHSVAVRADGTLWAWGYNRDGQLGVGDTVNRYFPVQIGTQSVWQAVVAGLYHTMALTSDGKLWGWGKGFVGQLGNGTLNQYLTPTPIATNATWRTIAAGQDHTVAIRSDGTLWAWGWNSSGQVGVGTVSEFVADPVQVAPGTTWLTIAAAVDSTFGVRSDGTLWGWGSNANGKLGISPVTQVDGGPVWQPPPL